MAEAIFLSAGVPDAKRAPQYAETADPVAIATAVSALLYVTLGRRPLVFGGQPAIIPMVWTVAQDMGVEYGGWVRLYQSRYFEDDFPEETAKFQNVVFTEKALSRAESLHDMRQRMFEETPFASAVFVGGMDGIVDEFRLLRLMQPHAKPVPLYSTGGAVTELAREGAPLDPELTTNLDYVGLLHRQLGVSPKEARFRRPADQPRDPGARLWRDPLRQ
jgi:SLOG cluster3 family